MLILLGAIGLVAGIVALILGSGWGVAVLLAGFAVLAVGIVRLLRIGGYRNEGAFFNGLGGQGRQQSEVSKEPESGAQQQGNVWDQMEGKAK